MGKSVLASIKQLVLIVFSVVLGLYLSERIEENKNEKDADVLMATIKSEVADSKELLEYWAPYHREAVNKLDTLIEEATFINDFVADDSALFREVFDRGTLMSRTPSNNAWDVAKSHPLIVYLDYEKLLILSKIYDQQKITYQLVPKLIELINSADFNSADKARENLLNFKNQLREIPGREMQLIAYFKEAEAILGDGVKR